MSKRQEFIDYVEDLMKDKEVPENVKNYWDAVKGTDNEEKPLFTDNGKLILKFLQEHAEDMPMCKAKDIGENIMLSSRTVSGGIRKLVSDGFVEKIGSNPTVYSITDAGKNITIED